MFTAYERSAFGELAGGFWIPLLLLLILRDRNPQASALAPSVRRICGAARAGDCRSVALECAAGRDGQLSARRCALWPSRSCAARGRRFFAPRSRSSLGLGLSAIYLVPAAVEQRWVQIRQAIDDPGLAIENSFLFARHADPNLELHDVELLRVSMIAVIMLGSLFFAVFVAWRRGKLPQRSGAGGFRWH